MKKCPLCQTEYNNMTKVCPLRHCSNCGSLKLESYKKRNFKTSQAKQNFVFILPPLSFFVLVYGYLFVQGDLILFLSIVAVYFVFFIGILFKITIKNTDCKECNVTNGSDLRVYLTSNGDVHDGIHLDKLKGSKGNQNYSLENIDTSVYDTVVIYCQPFGAYFGQAELN